MKLVACVTMWCLVSNAGANEKIKIACVGNSITYGATIDDREQNSYPAQLGRLLGDGFDVRNFGRNGATLLSKGDNPYRATTEYREASAFMPDWVFIELGSNDSKPYNRAFLEEFITDYKALIDSFATLPSRPRVVLLVPPPAFTTTNTGVTAKVVADEIVPRVRVVAAKTGCASIDLFTLFAESPELFPDALHPSKKGAARLAQRLYEHLQEYKTNLGN